MELHNMLKWPKLWVSEAPCSLQHQYRYGITYGASKKYYGYDDDNTVLQSFSQNNPVELIPEKNNLTY